MYKLMVHPPLVFFCTLLKQLLNIIKKMRENKDKHLLRFNITFKTLDYREYLPHLCFCFKQTKPKIVEYEVKVNAIIWF